MGVTIRQKESGKGKPWWVFVSHQGKRTSKKIGDKRTAEKVAKELRRKIKNGEFDFEPETVIPTFGQYYKKWLSNYVKLNLRESTFDEYNGILKGHVLPAFKSQKIDAITRGSIRDFLLSKYAGGLSQSRVMLFKDVISGVLGYAVDEELVDTNPTAKITKKLFPKGRKRPVNESEVFSENELETYLATCEEHFPKYYLFFLTACLTGMRLGELLALEWGSINLKNRYISIKQSYRRGRFTRPKNGKIRRVDMSDQLHEKLKNKLKQEFKDVSELVFQKDGRVIEQSWMNWIHKQILKKAELRHVKLHGFRHTFASHLLSKGVDAYYVSQQLGHSGISITCDVYGLFIRSEENRHVNLLDFGQKVATNLHPEGDQKIQPIEITSSI